MKTSSEKKSTRKPKQSRGIKTRGKIVEQGIRLFGEHGFHGVLADDIARAAGVSVGTFYAYFADKHELFLVILDHFIAEATAAVAEWSLYTTHNQICQETFVRKTVELLVTTHEIPSAIFREAEQMASHDEDIQKRLNANDQAVRQYIEKTFRHFNTSLPTETARVLAFVTYHATEGVIHKLVNLPEDDDVQKEDIISELSSILTFYFQQHSSTTPDNGGAIAPG